MCRIPLLLIVAAGLGLVAVAQKTNTDSVHDIIPPNFKSAPFSKLATATSAELQLLDNDLNALDSGASLQWCAGCAPKPGGELRALVNAYFKSKPQLGCSVDARWDRAVIFHVKYWDSTKIEAPVLISSSWYVYRHPRHWKKVANDLQLVRTTGTGDPFIYGASQILVIGIDRFKQGTKDEAGLSVIGLLKPSYSMTVSPGIPENMANAGALFTGLTGISSAALGAGGSKGEYAYIGAGCPSGTKHLPFDLSVTSTTQVQKQNETKDDNTGKNPLQNATPGNMSCGADNAADPACSVTRTFTSKDREWWDVSAGIGIPGVRETTLAFSSSASGNVSPAVTRHTELYAFFDAFPFFAFQPKESPIPHISIGVPVTTKSFYRPFFGLSENLTGWTHLQKKINLPVAVNFFGGVVLMKTATNFVTKPADQNTFDTTLQHHRVIKGLFGIEVPIGSVLSKLGGKSSGGGGKSGSGNANGKKGNS